ncbi:hypothetical protein [Streptomyces triticiradicis]|uniref:Uncharacterized protein n=1 Tax=Streptomyces triticiradicis TaxID=2651189 RepID=A0A7J5DHZ2_9ACTN|nr:hypothetical protein [Streptomyces triticiradicis]KAB1988286.1 hypothetical protein F8144_13835 [Streptomyces triticiradicis]
MRTALGLADLAALADTLGVDDPSYEVVVDREAVEDVPCSMSSRGGPRRGVATRRVVSAW